MNPSDGSATTISDNTISGGEIEAPHRVAIVSESKKGLVSGDLVVVDETTDNVLRVETDGTTSVLATGGAINHPQGIAIDNDGYLIVSGGDDEVVNDGAVLKVDPSDGSTTTIATYASTSGKIDEPHDISIDSAGDYIIADSGSNAVIKVETDGTTTIIASASTTGGVIVEPWGVAIDDYGLLIVTDAAANKVFKIDPVSGDLRTIANSSSTGNKLDEPSDVAIASDGSMYVTNFNNNTIVKIEESTSTNFLLAFAQKIRGDMVTHDDEHPGDATSQSEHDDFIVAVDGVIDDIGTNISNPNTVDKMDIFNDLKSARDSLMVHADMKEPVQHASLAHILLDSKRLADDQVRLNLASIDAEMNQAKAFLDAHINDFGDTTVHRDIRSQLDSILVKINTVQGDIYDTATANSIKSEIKEAFCDVIDHMINSDRGTHGHDNPFVFCEHN